MKTVAKWIKEDPLGYKLYIGESNESRNHLQIKAQMEAHLRRKCKVPRERQTASAQEQGRFR